MIHLFLDGSFFAILMICVIAKIRQTKESKIGELEKNLEKYAPIIFVGILGLSAILLGYKLALVPQGLHVDEAGALYDAICLSKYGVDRYLYQFPVYFINFGGGQNALYTYLAAFMIKLFGANTAIFRLPAVLLSLMSLVSLYQMICDSCTKKQALLTSFILSLCPWFIMKSRWGLESYLMCSLLTIATNSLMKAFKSGKKFRYFSAGVFFGLTLYTYAIAYMVVPLIIGIIGLYNLFRKKCKFSDLVVFALPLCILGIPLLLMLGVNSGFLENAKIPFFSIPKLWFYRAGEISLKNIPQNLKNIFDILFFKDFLNYNAIALFGTLYRLTIPLVIFGFLETFKSTIKDIKQKEFSLDFMMNITFVVVLLTGLCVTELNINKINSIYIPMIYFGGKFLVYLSNHMKPALGVIILLYCIHAGIFLKYYFTEFAHTDLQYFEQDIIQASKKAEELNKEKIYVENCINQTYIYTLIANPISPYEWNQTVGIQNGNVQSYGKYEFWVPQEIDEKAVYVLKENHPQIEILLKHKFQLKKYGQWNVFWK